MKQLSFDEINWEIPRKFAKVWPPSGVYLSSDFNTSFPPKPILYSGVGFTFVGSGIAPSSVVTSSGNFLITEPIKYITIDLTVSGADKYGKNTKD